MHRLDDERAAGAQHAPELAKRLRVSLTARVADRGEQVEDGIETFLGKGQLPVVGPDELQLGLPSSASGLVQKDLRAVRPGDAKSGTRERDGMAPEPARAVEDLGAGLDPCEPRGRERLVLGLLGILARRVELEVCLVEDPVELLFRHGGILTHHA